MAYIRVEDPSKGKDGLQSPIIKFIEDSILKTLLSNLNVQKGDIIFFGAGKLPQVLGQMGKGVKAFKKGMTDKDDDRLLEGNTSMSQEEKITDVEEIKS